MVGCTHWVWSETDCWLIKWMTLFATSTCQVPLFQLALLVLLHVVIIFLVDNHIECCSSAWPIHYNLHYNRWSSGRCPASCRKCRRCLRHGFRDLNGDLSASNVGQVWQVSEGFGIKTDPKGFQNSTCAKRTSLEKLCLEKKKVTCHQGVFTR